MKLLGLQINFVLFMQSSKFIYKSTRVIQIAAYNLLLKFRVEVPFLFELSFVPLDAVILQIFEIGPDVLCF
jgi:hypothetical protein